MTILSILDEIAATSSRLTKEAILKREKDNYLLQRVIKAAYDPYINYWILKLPQFVSGGNTLSLGDAIAELQVLATRQKTGDAGRAHLASILERCNPADATVISRIIDRDLRIGCTGNTANKVWPGLVPDFEVMLAHKDCSGIKFPCIGQVKMDGMRVHVYFDGKQALVYTRNGKLVECHGQFDQACMEMMVAGETFDGELLCFSGNHPMDRKTGNGICNKGVKGTISMGEAQNLRLVAWDIVDFTSTKPYIDRLTDLAIRIKEYSRQTQRAFNPAVVYLVPTRDIKDQAEASEFFFECVQNGEEGTILKNTNSVWEGKRTKNLGKMKEEKDCTLRVVGWEEGTGKNVGLLGALVCESEDGKVRVNVGTGFDDRERKQYDKSVIGKLLDVRYNARIQDKKRDTDSLFLPRFLVFRTDKTEADNSGAIL